MGYLVGHHEGKPGFILGVEAVSVYTATLPPGRAKALAVLSSCITVNCHWYSGLPATAAIREPMRFTWHLPAGPAMLLTLSWRGLAGMPGRPGLSPPAQKRASAGSCRFPVRWHSRKGGSKHEEKQKRQIPVELPRMLIHPAYGIHRSIPPIH